MNTDEYWDNSKRGICQNVLLPLYPQCVLLNLYFYRQFLVSAASDKRWFLFGKVTKTCQTFFFFWTHNPVAVYEGSLTSHWRLLISPETSTQKEIAFSAWPAILWFLCFFLCRLQEQEQALNLSIKEATAKVSPVSSDFGWSAAARLAVCMPEPLWKLIINSECSVAVYDEVRPPYIGISIHGLFSPLQVELCR